MPENMPEGWARCSDRHPVLAAGDSWLLKTPWFLPAQQAAAYTKSGQKILQGFFQPLQMFESRDMRVTWDMHSW